jgi:tetratricopeptide (TPR) repeat protein
MRVMRKARSAAVATILAGMLCACAPINQDRAQTAYAQGRYDDAVNDVTAALSHDPGNLQLRNLAAQIYTQRGVKYYKDGQMLAASNDFHNAIGYDPTYAPAYDYLGMLSFQQHSWQDAVNFGDKAAGLEGKPDPDYVNAARKEILKVRAGGFKPYLVPQLPPPPPPRPY